MLIITTRLIKVRIVFHRGPKLIELRIKSQIQIKLTTFYDDDVVNVKGGARARNGKNRETSSNFFL